jgi:elongation factor Ts
MNITADTVKQLRDRTGAGMMECKRALVETGGDLDAAAEVMRKAGLAKADRKAERIAAEGAIASATGPDGRVAVLVEVNCETDFVAREADFASFARDVANLALERNPADLAALMALTGAGGQTLEERRRALIAKIGENISVRRFVRIAAKSALGIYLHGTRIGAAVALDSGDAALAKDLAMHVAASNPQYLDIRAVPGDTVAKEREILSAQAANEGKPPEIVAKMVEGRLRKYLGEITLLGQPFVKDPDQTVEQLLKKANGSVASFARLEVGAGIEKKQENFAAEVMAQVRGASKS